MQLTELGGLVLWFDPRAALEGPARLARAISLSGANDIEEAEQLLQQLGVRSELAYEREAARDAAP